MRKVTTSLLLGLLVFTLSGCGNNSNTTPNNNSITGSATEQSESNSPATESELPEVTFSLASGFYDKTQKVTLSCNVEGAKIYYTLDGSTPTENSTLFENPIKIRRKQYDANVLSAIGGISVGNKYTPDYCVDKGTVIRAVAYLPDGTVSPVTHTTYFVDIDREQYAGVPVVSLITDADNLFDYETGIYVLGKTHEEFVSDPENAALESWQMKGNYTNRGREWERPVSVELLTADGSEGFKQDMGIRIMGGSTRNQAQKSFRLIAREDYGKKSLDYELIPGNLRSDGTGIVDEYKSFILRIGGNDADTARLRDPLLQNLVEDADFETQQNTPCVVYLHGEYWGMYTIKEDYNDNYLENNYGVDNKNVVLIKCGEVEEGEEDDLALFQDMYNFITGNDMSDPALYQKACELVDMDSFADYIAFGMYIFNKDSIFDNNNWRMWRVRSTDSSAEWMDGKWRMLAYDNDFSTGVYDGPMSASTDNITEKLTPSTPEERQANLEEYVPCEIFLSLMESDEFREKLILAICDMRNIYLETKNVEVVLEEMGKTYVALMPDTFKRFGPDWLANSPDRKMSYTWNLYGLYGFLAQRYDLMPNMLSEVFKLGTPLELTVSTGDTSLGNVRINNRPTDLGESFTGMYFNETTVTLTAVPAEGCKFVGWEVEGGKLSDTTSETISFDMESNMTVHAMFEKK